MIDFKSSWNDHFMFIEFAYNNSYCCTIQMVPYKALYGCTYGSPLGWFEVGETAFIGSDSIHDDMDKVQFIRDKLKQPKVVRSSMQM